MFRSFIAAACIAALTAPAVASDTMDCAKAAFAMWWGEVWDVNLQTLDPATGDYHASEQAVRSVETADGVDGFVLEDGEEVLTARKTYSDTGYRETGMTPDGKPDGSVSEHEVITCSGPDENGVYRLTTRGVMSSADGDQIRARNTFALSNRSLLFVFEHLDEAGNWQWQASVVGHPRIPAIEPGEDDDWLSVLTYERLAQAAAEHASPGKEYSPRRMTAMYLAMFSAGNAVEARYSQYLDALPEVDVEGDKAIALTAIAFLREASGLPRLAAGLEAELLDGVPAAKREKLEALAAAAVQAALARAAEKSGEVPDWVPYTAPGQYVPTTIPSTSSIWQVLQPWALASLDAVRTDGPPALNSERYARDFNEVKALGAGEGSERTQQQTVEAVFWLSDFEDLYQVMARRSMDLLEETRAAMLISMAADDAWSASVDSKMHFDYWRPVTAIRLAATDGNDSTVPDPGWSPLLKTPDFPEYTSGHCQVTSAIMRVMEALVPLEAGEKLTYEAPDLQEADRQYIEDESGYDLSQLDGVTVTVDSYGEILERTCDGRIYAGAHFRFTNDDSIVQGRAAADAVLEAIARPTVAVAAE